MKLSQAQRRILSMLRDTGKLPLNMTERQYSVLKKAGLIEFDSTPIGWSISEQGRAALEQRPERKAPAQRKPLRKLGKKGMEWKQIREKELKPAFKAAGITKCEICGTDNYLGFAHSRRRRNCTTPELMRTVVLLCNKDHDELEALPEKQMETRILSIISARKVAVCSI